MGQVEAQGLEGSGERLALPALSQLTTNLETFLSSMRADATSKSSLMRLQQRFSFRQYSCSSRVVMLELGLGLPGASGGTARVSPCTRSGRFGDKGLGT